MKTAHAPENGGTSLFPLFVRLRSARLVLAYLPQSGGDKFFLMTGIRDMLGA
jgi:hypothetical protein